MIAGQKRLTQEQVQWCRYKLYCLRARKVAVVATDRGTLKIMGALEADERAWFAEHKSDVLEYLSAEPWYERLQETWAEFADFVKTAEAAYAERSSTDSDRERVRKYVDELGTAFDQKRTSAWTRALARARHLIARELTSRAAQSAHASLSWRPASKVVAVATNRSADPLRENVSDSSVIVNPAARTQTKAQTRRFDWKTGKTIDAHANEVNEQALLPVEEQERQADSDDEETTEAEQNQSRYQQSHQVRGGGWMSSASDEAYEERYQNKCRECGTLTGNYIRNLCVPCLEARHGLTWILDKADPRWKGGIK